MINVEVIEASRSPQGVTLWTIAMTYPRFIHSELMTHRVFSRNASSSRAIPIIKSIMAVLRNSAMPVAWGSHKAGMQAGEDLTGIRLGIVKAAWGAAKYAAVGCAWVAMKAGAHKQIANRMLEPWSHITVLVSSTDWSNFDALRNHPDADPTIEELAKQIVAARSDYQGFGKVKDLEPGEWHLPYITDAEYEASWRRFGPHEFEAYQWLRKLSAAYCARVSYLTHGGENPDYEKDIQLYERLAMHEPMHASPLEHQATPDTTSWQETVSIVGNVTTAIKAGQAYDNPELHGNFHGFIQNRKLLDNENVVDSHYKRKLA